jgi:hypothetical protein
MHFLQRSWEAYNRRGPYQVVLRWRRAALPKPGWILIDGYNLLQASGVFGSSGAQKHGLQIEFAPRGTEADDVMEELIRSHSSPRALKVVSSDHRLHRAARRRKATPIDSDKWVASVRLEQTRDRRESVRNKKLEPEELNSWLKEFGDI